MRDMIIITNIVLLFALHVLYRIPHIHSGWRRGDQMLIG